MPSFNQQTGALFGTSRAEQVLDLSQSIVDRVLTRLGDRIGLPQYGSLYPILGQVSTQALIDSLEAAAVSDPRVGQGEVSFVRDQDTLTMYVKGRSVMSVGVNQVRADLSPLYVGLVASFEPLTGQSFDLRELLSWDQVPIEFVRGFALETDLFAHTQVLGEAYERKAAEYHLDFFTLRDTKAIFDLFARLAGMSYQIRVDDPNPGDVYLCFTPPPGGSFTPGLEQFLNTFSRRAAPFYTGTFEIEECINALATWRWNYALRPTPVVMHNYA